MQNNYRHRKTVLALLLSAPILVDCGATTSDFFSSDLLSKDAEWFSRSGRPLIKNVAIDAPPLTPNKPVGPEDLVSADGGCPGMATAGVVSNANASDGGAATAPTRVGTVALGHAECDVVRGIGAPDSVNISQNQRGERVAVVNFSRGQRAGIYTFTAGRLTSVERAAEPAVDPKTAKPKKKKPAAS